MFKKRAQVKTVNLLEDAETIVVEDVKKEQIEEERDESNLNTKQTNLNRKINIFNMK